MAPLTAGTSKVANSTHSRPGSVARDIVRRRDKPYKTETQKVLAKKRKLDLHTAYRQAMPAGYHFLPVGHPDLAERAKELSRQKGLPVNVVNSRPVSKFAEDPAKVSHHIARVGYHFKAEVLDEAAQQLGYRLVHGQFVKESDEKSRQGKIDLSRGPMAQTLAKYGIDPNALEKDATKENTDQVRAAIKELFPKIPDRDLSEIVQHAWEEGTSRVGLKDTIELPRRVQLATIARIRHMYTDYDRLLRAFEWKEARQMVENDCLRKLIEWRGENDEEEGDDELEEIVRETIVLDDEDDDDASNAVIDLDAGDTSDGSVEITHHVAADSDFAAEAHHERPARHAHHFQPHRDGLDQRKQIAKRKIDDARERMRNGASATRPAPEAAYLGTYGLQASVPGPSQGQIIRLNVQPDQYGHYPSEIVVDGQRMRLAPINQPQHTAQSYYQQPLHANGTHGYTITSGPSSNSQLSTPPIVKRDSHDFHNRPIASIETSNEGAEQQHLQTFSHLRYPKASDTAYGAKLHHEQEPISLMNHDVHISRTEYPAQPTRISFEVIDPVSPTRNTFGNRYSPKVLDSNHRTHEAPPSHYYHGTEVYSRQPLVQDFNRHVSAHANSRQYASSIHEPRGHNYATTHPIHGAPAPVQQVPIAGVPLPPALSGNGRPVGTDLSRYGELGRPTYTQSYNYPR